MMEPRESCSKVMKIELFIYLLAMEKLHCQNLLCCQVLHINLGGQLFNRSERDSTWSIFRWR